MSIAFKIGDTAIIRGIKTVGIGKKGSKPLEPDLIQEILQDLKEGHANPVPRAAFFAALFLKGITLEERKLEEFFAPGTFQNPSALAKALTPDAPPFVREICGEILSGTTLDVESAHRLGKFLFSSESGDSARGLIASALRVRYETIDEYDGLLRAMNDTLEPTFKEKVQKGEPIIQLSEPFDGVDNSYVLTPLIAKFLHAHGFRVVTLVGRNSGPKMGNTVLDIISKLEFPCAKGNFELGNKKPEFGWYFHQADLSKAIDRWVEIRRLTVKRPFLSTLEKFLNPAGAHILITSAFHAAYTEKMVAVAERAAFGGALVLRSGQEGSLSFPLNRSVKILCSTERCEGEYVREEIEINPNEFLEREIPIDEKLTNPSITENTRLIRQFVKEGKSDNDFFNQRVKITCLGIKRALDVILKKGA